MGSSTGGYESSCCLSHDWANTRDEGILKEEVLQLGGVGNHVVGSDSFRIEFRQDSMGMQSGRGSSRRSCINISQDVGVQIIDSINLSRNLSQRIFEIVDSSLIAQVGDYGDRVVVDDKEEDNTGLDDNVRATENGPFIFPDAVLIGSGDFESCSAYQASTMSSLTEGIVPHLRAAAILHSSGENKKQGKLPRVFDYISYMIHLAVFGVLGGFTRYLLEKLFSPGLLVLTRDETPLYLDLPANMLGSFFMGWFGIVLKADIRHVLSDHVAVGLTSGYLGSLTTFSGWNQKMLELSSEGAWVSAITGVVLGMLLVNESIRMGVESAEALRQNVISKFNQDSLTRRCWKLPSRKRHMAITIIMQLLLLFLCALSWILAMRKLDSDNDGAIPWVGSLVGPLSVWARWYLARLNGRGIGRQGWLKWLPVGTLLTNVLAACLMAALSTINRVVDKKRYGLIIGGVQFGFLGGLSTVSTFAAEVYAMRQSGQRGRALVYAATTIVPSFGLGTLIYSVPIWTKAA